VAQDILGIAYSIKIIYSYLLFNYYLAIIFSFLFTYIKFIAPTETNITCTAWGDTHISKFSGDVFHYQGYGEYTMTNFSSGAHSVAVQIRMEPYYANVTYISAV
jgi:hypothetical protein